MKILEGFYRAFRADSPWNTPFTHIPHSNVWFVRSAIREKLGIELDLDTVEDLLYEEGMAKVSDYGIPSWYVKKYGLR